MSWIDNTEERAKKLMEQHKSINLEYIRQLIENKILTWNDLLTLQAQMLLENRRINNE